MKIKIIGALIALGILSVLIAGCGQGAGGAIKGMMKVLPDDIEYFTYFDVKSMRTDRDLRDLYDELKYEMDADSMDDETGLYFSDADAIVGAISEDYDEWVIITGDFDFDDFRDAMEDNGYDEDEYRGVEVWSDGYDAYALINNMVVFCDNEDRIRDAIRLSIGSGSSMYDNEDYADVLSKIPAGIYVMLMQNEYEEYSYTGGTLSKVSGADDILEFNACFKYSSERRAEDDMRELEDGMEEAFDLYAVDVRQSGEFITITGEIDMADFFYIAFFY